MLLAFLLVACNGDNPFIRVVTAVPTATATTSIPDIVATEVAALVPSTATPTVPASMAAPTRSQGISSITADLGDGTELDLRNGCIRYNGLHAKIDCQATESAELYQDGQSVAVESGGARIVIGGVPASQQTPTPDARDGELVNPTFSLNAGIGIIGGSVCPRMATIDENNVVCLEDGTGRTYDAEPVAEVVVRYLLARRGITGVEAQNQWLFVLDTESNFVPSTIGCLGGPSWGGDVAAEIDALSACLGPAQIAPRAHPICMAQHTNHVSDLFQMESAIDVALCIFKKNGGFFPAWHYPIPGESNYPTATLTRPAPTSAPASSTPTLTPWPTATPTLASPSCGHADHQNGCITPTKTEWWQDDQHSEAPTRIVSGPPTGTPIPPPTSTPIPAPQDESTSNLNATPDATGRVLGVGDPTAHEIIAASGCTEWSTAGVSFDCLKWNDRPVSTAPMQADEFNRLAQDAGISPVSIPLWYDICLCETGCKPSFIDATAERRGLVGLRIFGLEGWDIPAELGPSKNPYDAGIALAHAVEEVNKSGSLHAVFWRCAPAGTRRVLGGR